MLCKRAGICLLCSDNVPGCCRRRRSCSSLLHHIWQQFFNSPLTNLVVALSLGLGEKTSQNEYVSGAHLVSKSKRKGFACSLPFFRGENNFNFQDMLLLDAISSTVWGIRTDLESLQQGPFFRLCCAISSETAVIITDTERERGQKRIGGVSF